jgi:hypothetical protein
VSEVGYGRGRVFEKSGKCNTQTCGTDRSLKMAVMLKGLHIYSLRTRWSTRIQLLLPTGPQFFIYWSVGRFMGQARKRHVFLVCARTRRVQKRSASYALIAAQSPFGMCVIDRRRNPPVGSLERTVSTIQPKLIMSVTPVLRAGARSAYRDLLRASASTFYG